MKKTKKRISIFLVFCMVLSMFVGIPVNADENEQMTGLVYTWPNWDTNPFVPDGAEYYQDLFITPKDTHTLYIGNMDANGNVTAVTDGIQIMDAEGNPSKDGEITAFEGTDGEISGMYSVTFQQDKTGTYKIGTSKDECITVEVSEPEAGFYSSSEINMESYIQNSNYSYSDADNVIYFAYKTNPDENRACSIVTDEEGNALLYPYYDAEEAITTEDYASITKVSGDAGTDIYKITLGTKFDGNCLFVKIKTTYEDGGAETTEQYGIDLRRKMVGLVLKDGMAWSDAGVPSVHEEAEFTKESWPDLYGTILYFAYVDPDTGEETTLTAENISITLNGVNAGVTYSQRKDNTELIDLSFSQTGDYTVTYGGAETDNTITLHVNNPEVGFYKTAEHSPEGLIHDDFEYSGEDNTCYMIFRRGAYSKLDLNNITYTIDFWDDTYPDITEGVTAEELAEYLTITPLEEYTLSDNAEDYTEEAYYVYKVEIKKELAAGFGLRAEVQKTDVWEDGNGGYMFSTEGSYTVWRDQGIKYREKLEGLVAQWDIDWEQEVPVVRENAEISKSMDANLYGCVCRFGYVATEGDTPDPVQADKISVFYEGRSATKTEVEYQKFERNEDLTEFTFHKVGDYTISYTDGNEVTSSVTIHVNFPEIGFYETEEMTEEGFLSYMEYDRSVGKTFYIIPNTAENWKSFQYTVTANEDVSGVTVNGKALSNATNLEGVSKVTIAAGMNSAFDLKAVGTITYQDGSVDEEWHPEGEIRCEYSRIVEDGNPISGFAGCFIPDSSYDNNTCWFDWGDMDCQYWVHADTIQDVIDELAAIKEDGGSVTVNGQSFTADTGDKIWINVSYDANYAENAKALQTITDTNGFDILIQGAKEYDENDNCIASYELPELLFNTTGTNGSVKIFGDMKEVGEDAANIYLQNLTADIQIGNWNETADAWDFTSISDEDFVNSFTDSSMIDWEGIKVALVPAVGEVTTKKEDLDTTAIRDVALVEDAALPDKVIIDNTTIEAEKAAAVVESIKAGKTLDLSLNIGSLDEKTADAAVKSGITGIADLAKADKNVISGLKYLDIGLEYSIEEAEGTNTITGNLTKTRMEIVISVDLAADYVKKTNAKAKSCKPVVYRYHDGEAEKLDSEYKAGKLTFKTDRFSVYAIAVEEVVPTGIKITTAPKKTTYTVGEKFDKTGMVVKLVYSDGSADAITDYTVPTKALTESDKEISVVYGSYTVKQAITVKPSASETKLPAKGETITDAGSKAKYTVTTAGKTGGTVTYTKAANSTATNVSVPKTITKDGVTYKVTAIGNNAFSGCSKLKTVSIGENVTTIGSKAFYKCTALTSITIPAKVTAIGKNAFYGCKKLTKVTIGKGVKTIGASAFSGCSKLKTVSMGANVTTIGDKAFYKCTTLNKVTIPAKVTKIGKQAFYGCKTLKTITIKTTKLTSSKVGSSAFKGIYAKATIKVPKNKLTSYKKILRAKGVGSKAKIKK